MFNEDTDFDAYWEDEARNPNRNRIRIGRQYQATVTPLLKPGENDGRRCEDLETLKWKPENQLDDQQLDRYLSVAKAVSLFARAFESNHTNSVTGQPVTNSKKAESDSKDKKENEKESEDGEESTSEEGNGESGNKGSDSVQSSSLVTDGLSARCSSTSSSSSSFSSSSFPSSCSSPSSFSYDHQFKMPISSMHAAFKLLTAQENSSVDTKGSWSPTETYLFILAFDICGKNFSAIKKEFLPWKSVKSIIEFYYLNKEWINNSNLKKLDDNNLNLIGSSQTKNTSTSSHFPKFESTEIDQFIEKPNSDDSEDENVSHLYGLEVKPLKAKPLMDFHETDLVNPANVSNLGSLKFYMDGHLVLKLNAKKETSTLKCQWVESSDTPNISRNLRWSKNSNKFLSSSEKLESDSKHMHKDKCQHQVSDDVDDCSLDSSDDDSLGSSESNYLSSCNLNSKKAKVRVEDCYVPLPSPFDPTSASTVKDSIINNSKSLIKQEAGLPMIKKESLNSSTFLKQTPSNKILLENQNKKKSQKISIWPSDQQKNPISNLSENSKWFMEKSSVQPPVAHASSRLSTTSSSTITSNSMTHNNSSLVSVPVDLTWKNSPPKSSLSFNCTSQKSKMIHCLSPPKVISPTLKKINKLQLLPLSEANFDKDTDVMCQKDNESNQVKQKKICPDRSSPISSLQLSSQTNQMSWFQNSIVSYVPFYEQYLQYFCRYGFPATGLPNNTNPIIEKETSQLNDSFKKKVK